MNWCISTHAYRYLIIHAAVVEKNGFAAVLPAPLGSGKSTLCAALVYNGWRLLSDELTLIRTDNGDIVTVPRPVSLKDRFVDIIDNYVAHSVFSPRVADTVKGEVAHLKPPADSVARADVSVPPAWIIFPKYEAGAALRLDEIPRHRAVLNLAENAFNFTALGKRGLETLVRTVDASQCYKLVYRSLDNAINAFGAQLCAMPDGSAEFPTEPPRCVVAQRPRTIQDVRGRVFSDVDILVPKPALASVEAALMLDGYISMHLDPYYLRYYRTWMHELPPMQHIKRQTVIDVHHA